jgi:hypothetical protein
MSLDTQIFKDRLLREFGSDSSYNTFNELIISTESLIAGGSILSAYHNLEINDIDIYVHIDNACRLKEGLDRIGFKLGYKNYIAPAYDRSFFRRNHILARFPMRKRLMSIDIIIVKNSIPLLDVVRNFDLTFCEIWYDGNTVNAVDPIGVLSKTGQLKPDYVSLLLVNFNKFTIKRMEKYKRRGFTITYSCTGSSYDVDFYDTKTITTPEEWVVYKIFNYIVTETNSISEYIRSPLILLLDDGRYRECSFYIVCESKMEVYSVANLDNMVRTVLEVPEGEIRNMYMEILSREGYFHFPGRFQRYIEDYLNISHELMDEGPSVSYPSVIDWEDEEPEGEIEEEPEEDYIFEEADVDERDMPNSTCSDLYTLEDDKNIVAHLEEEDTFLFINRGSTNDFDILCFEKSYIEGIISDKNNNWLYECTGRLIPGTNDRSMGQFINYPYIKVPINDSGLNGFIPLIQLRTLLRSNNRIYYIYPFLEADGTQKMITHTASWQNAYSSNPNYVSANHCQAGSNILVYTLKLCREPERCVRSIAQT